MSGRRWRWWAALAVVLLGALVLRAWNLDFDQRQHLHPDERHWSLTSAALAAAPAPDRHGTLAGPVLDWLDGDRSPANAYRGTESFVYGPVTLAAGRALAGWLHDGATTGAQPADAVVSTLDALGLPLLDDGGGPRFDDAYQVDLVGRLVGVIADTLAVLVIALVGRRVAGAAVGLLAAGLAALSPMAIQHAHFFGAEPMLTLASALTLLATLSLDRGTRTRAAIVSGGLAGLAAGAAVAVKISGVGIAVVPVLVAAIVLARRRRRVDLVRLAAVLVGSYVGFRVLCPGAFDGLGLLPRARFLDDQRRAQELAMADLPPSLQWAGRPFLLTPLRFLFLYTVGPGTMLAAVVGVVALVRARPRRFAGLIVVLAVVVALVLPLRSAVTTGRYFVPALPALFVAAGVGLVTLVAVGGRRAVAAVAGSGRAATARRWGRAAARPVAVALAVLAAWWGVAFVVGVYGGEHTRVEASRWIGEHVDAGSVLTIEAWDDGLPLSVDGVEPTDYESVELTIVAPDSVGKLQELGAVLPGVDVVIESSPRVWGVVGRLPARFPSSIEFFEALDDGTLGFRRAATFTSPPELGPFRLDERWAEEAFSVYDHPEVRIWVRERAVGTVDVIARLDPIAAATAMPVAPADATANGTLLRPDEVEAARATPTYDAQFDVDANPWVHAVGWLVVIEVLGFAAFVLLLPLLRRLPDAGLGVSKLLGVALVAFGVFGLATWGGLALDRTLVIGVGAALVAAGTGAAWWRRVELGALWRERRTTLVVGEVVALLAFAALIAVRAADPDIWHPYRGGEKPLELTMLTAVMRARTLPPPDPWFAGGAVNYYYVGYLLLAVPGRLLRTAPTLALNLAPALLAMTAAGATYTTGAAVRVLRPWRRRDAPGPGRARPWRAGLIAVVAVLLVPNGAVLVRALYRLLGREEGVFDWWAVSRVIPAVPSPSEFPAWSFLFADVHPHVVGLAVVATVLAVVLAWWDAVTAGRPLAVVVGLGALVGFLVGLARAVNTWDLPLVLVVVASAVGAIALGARDRWRPAGASLVALAVVYLGAWAPYARRMEVTDAGLAAAAHEVPVGSWAQQFLLFAVVTVVVAAVPLAAWVRHRRRRDALAALGATGLGLVAVAGVGMVAADATAAVSAVLAAMAVVAAVAAARTPAADAGPTTPPLALGLLAMGWLTLATIEVVHVANDFTLNTIFKGWFQAWLLLAIGAGVALEAVAFAVPAAGSRWRPAALPRHLARAALLVAALGVVAFGRLAVPARLADRVSPDGPSLDGLAFLDELRLPGVAGDESFVPGEDLPLIRWLQANVTGLPTIAEAPGIEYRWTSRIATYTGLPTLAGWRWHGVQQRRNYGSVVEERRADLEALYTSGDERAITLVLQRHRVGYVVFGTAEREVAGARARTALSSYPCHDVVFRHDDLWIAAVDQRCVDAQAGALPVTPG